MLNYNKFTRIDVIVFSSDLANRLESVGTLTCSSSRKSALALLPFAYFDADVGKRILNQVCFFSEFYM